MQKWALMAGTAVLCAALAVTAHGAPKKHAGRKAGSAHHAAKSAGASHATGRTAKKGAHGRHAAAVAKQPAMAPERALQIQNALIKSGYMSGVPSGSWDASSQAAMQKFQKDNGWQSKVVPDARALNKLGLGAATLPATGTTETPQPQM